MTKTIEEIKAYISEFNNKYQEGITTEHSFRGALETLFKNLTDLTVVNEAMHIDCGAPNLTLLQKNIPIGYVEAKDIGKNLNSKDYKNQFDRYKKALDNRHYQKIIWVLKETEGVIREVDEEIRIKKLIF